MNYVQTIKAIHDQFEEIIQFQNQLNCIQEDTMESIKSIIDNSFIQSREKLSILLRLIQQCTTSRPKSFELYVDLIMYISHHIQQHFSSFELLNDLIQNNYLRYKLFERGLIHLSTVIYYLKNNHNPVLFFLFAFEIKENDPTSYSHYWSQSPEYRDVLGHTNPELHRELRSKGLNTQQISQYIRNDDLDQFQFHLSRNNISINTLIHECQYENRPYSENALSLIEYAAMFGSINIFKFLLMRNCSLSPDLPMYAIIGGNYEIVHLLEEQEHFFNKPEFLDTAIEFHQNELVEYIKDSLDVCFDNQSLRTSICVYNLPVFFEIMLGFKHLPIIESPKMTLLYDFVQNGFVNLVESFYKYIEEPEKEKLINESIRSKRFDVFNFLYSTIVVNEKYPINNQKLLWDSVSVGHMKIFQYLLQFNENYFDIKNELNNGILHIAAAYGDSDIMEYIVSLKPTQAQLNCQNKYGI